ncbi:MAG: type IX secretion system sortase PorU [Bacteroidales bacterium]|jgi:hypothetical protein|nr:type IX secretion system sortase PorU [Bacteroidales bacterium]
MNKQRPIFYFYYLFIAILFLIQSNSLAQVITKSYNVPKFKIFESEYNNRIIKTLTFDEAITTSEFITLPALWDKIEVNHLYASYKYSLSNLKYEALTSEETKLIPEEYTFDTPKVDLKTGTEENRYYALLSIIPIIKNSNGQYQRLVSCEIRVEGFDPIASSKTARNMISVLASGNWYKIAVKNTGLHKITYNDLKSMGISMPGLHSSSIALFGNGGGAISDINPEIQIDDLLECPIMIVDNGNDIFDENSYLVFYAQGPHSWEFNENSNIFSHQYNIYSDNAYYFINVDPGIGNKKRVEEKNFLNQTENGVINSLTFYDFYEKDVINFGESGREWFDEPIYASTTKTYNFVLPELYNNKVRTKIKVASTGTSSSKMELSWENNTQSFLLLTSPYSYYANNIFEQELPVASRNFALTLSYTSAQNSSTAHLDYIEIQAQCKLAINSGAMPFAILENLKAGNISMVKLLNASSQTKIWDVTEHNEVYALKGNLSGTELSFKTPTEKMRRFVAFDGSSYYSITSIGKVENQNLHGFSNVDMVIVSHPIFLSEANRLAQFRAKENNITVKVVTTEQVYNEFSSGAQDIVAIRNFMRFLYDTDSQRIKYLLLFGRPSYDYRGRVQGTRIFVPNYQGKISTSENASRSCDDFFGILGINGGSLSMDLINVAVGRFPVSTLAQAKIAVDKTINASVRYKIATQNASQISNFGDWRNMMTFVADDEDDNRHFKDAEAAAGVIESNFPVFNLEKIYCDAYTQISFAGGQRYPDVNKAINMRMERGALVISYFGHGGGNGWAHERILEIVDINNWKNKFNQPFMITITCSFGWYDKPAISPAELAFLNDNGGVCAIITTSRVTGSNNSFGNRLFYEIGGKINGRYKTVGEIHKLAKNNIGGTYDGSNMIYLMGDPAMKINIPNYNIHTEEILSDNLQKTDTLRALSKVTVKGKVTDNSGNILTNFNGNVFPSILDKAFIQKTLGQDPASEVAEFVVQNKVLFKGNATVTNGNFEFSFYIPKDINFEYGKGKISYYAASENEDAGGYYDDFFIGGMSNNPIADTKGPEIEIFLNDDKFVPGGITNQNPTLLLKLKDDYGINTSGNGIGHDLVAILDNNIEKQMVLNDFYLADQDSYNSGTVRYALTNLQPGTHSIKVRAWDICNNPSEASLDFIVKSDEKLKIEHVLNYPNPFTTKTSFFFEHNQPIETFDIIIHIFTISGKLVKTIRQTQFLEGNRSDAIDWNGRDEYGDTIGKGVYLYRITVRNSKGETVEKIEKIAIL